MWKNGYPYRCKCCTTRKTFKQKVHWYRETPVCASCGSTLWRLDNYRLHKEHKVNRCNCDGYHFPHRRGSKWCREYQGTLTDQDYQDRYLQL